MTRTAPILPGATLGILGGGQLGRMTALAARAMGYRVHVLDPDPDCAARGVVDGCVTAAWDDADAAARFAAQCDVVTLEIEKVSPAVLDAAAQHAPVQPGAALLAMIRDRARQKRWLDRYGFPVPDFAEARTPAELVLSLARVGPQCYVKATTGGYDGRGQVRVDGVADADAAWDALGRGPVLVEEALDLEGELSVLVARRPRGESVVYPVAANRHRDRVLDWSILPGPVPEALARCAQAMAREIAETARVEGLLVVEMFVARGGRLFVNELAPRPHNSYHASERACVTGQFEQLVRAVCDLPLGSVEVVQPAAIANLLGDAWDAGGAPPFERGLEVPGVRVHLYGKKGARPGRKMGHLSAVGGSPEEALARVHAARQRVCA